MIDRFVMLDGVRTFVRDSGGEGDPVLLLHGFPQTGRCWDRVVESLGAGVRTIVPDVPGFGRSDRPRSHEAGEIARLMMVLLDELGIDRATVVGHDWGGTFTFRIGLDYPERVHNLVVTNSPFRKVNLLRAFHVPLFNIPFLPDTALTLMSHRAVPFILHAGSAKKDVFEDDAMREYEEAYSTRERVQSALAFYRVVGRRQLAHMLHLPGKGSVPQSTRIAAPTLIVWGMQDRVLPFSLMSGIERSIPKVRFVQLDDCGHFVPEEGPVALAGAIEAHLARTS